MTALPEKSRPRFDSEVQNFFDMHSKNGNLSLDQVSELLEQQGAAKTRKQTLVRMSTEDMAVLTKDQSERVQEFTAQWVKDKHKLQIFENSKQMTDPQTKDGVKFHWDLCLVFKVGIKDKKMKVTFPPGYCEENCESYETVTTKEMLQTECFAKRTGRIIGLLQDVGLQTHTFLSVQEDEVYVLVGATEKRVASMADRLSYILPLDSEIVRSVGAQHGLGIAENIGSLDPMVLENLFAPYKNFKDNRIHLYKKQADGSIFSHNCRLKLTKAIIESEIAYGGANLQLSKFRWKADQPLVSVFPLHDAEKKAELEKLTKSCKAAFYPPKEIRDRKSVV